MSDLTKRALAQSLKKIAVQKPIDKITIDPLALIDPSCR